MQSVNFPLSPFLFNIPFPDVKNERSCTYTPNVWLYDLYRYFISFYFILLVIIFTYLFPVIGTALQAGISRVRFPIVSLDFFIDTPSGRTMALGWTQPLTEMSTRNISWG